MFREFCIILPTESALMSKTKNPFEPILDLIPRPVRNRYAMVAISLGIWMLLFDKHDVFTLISLNQSIDKIEEDQAFYKREIKSMLAEKANLKKNAEKHAREKYYMSRPDEDVFIIDFE
jgi:cell division protein DivIC